MLKHLTRSINLRDFGGIATDERGVVRRGVLFRSAALSLLPPAQIEAIRNLKIRSIVDLRFDGERALHPTPWEDIGCKSYVCREFDPTSAGDLSALLGDETLTASSSHSMMMRVYKTLPFEHADILRRLFHLIAAKEGPYLIHCTAGKDRTGMAASLILSALGVPYETILTDYLATVEFDILASPAFRRDEPFSAARLEALRPIFSVSRDYLDAMFGAIAARDGSVHGFLQKTLGLEDATLQMLRSRLVEQRAV